jgi:hypothetical protein
LPLHPLSAFIRLILNTGIALPSASDTCYIHNNGSIDVAAKTNSCLEGGLAHILAGKPDFLAEIYHGFPWSLMVNAGLVLQLSHNHFVPNLLQVIIYLPILPFNTQ